MARIQPWQRLSHLIPVQGEAIARRMAEVIAQGRVGEINGPPQGLRVNITLGKHTAVLSLFRFGKRETWLLTGWKEDGSGSMKGVNPNHTYARHPSGIRNDVGAETPSAKTITSPTDGGKPYAERGRGKPRLYVPPAVETGKLINLNKIKR